MNIKYDYCVKGRLMDFRNFYKKKEKITVKDNDKVNSNAKIKWYLIFIEDLDNGGQWRNHNLVLILILFQVYF